MASKQVTFAFDIGDQVKTPGDRTGTISQQVRRKESNGQPANLYTVDTGSAGTHLLSESVLTAVAPPPT